MFKVEIEQLVYKLFNKDEDGQSLPDKDKTSIKAFLIDYLSPTMHGYVVAYFHPDTSNLAKTFDKFQELFENYCPRDKHLYLLDALKSPYPSTLVEFLWPRNERIAICLETMSKGYLKELSSEYQKTAVAVPQPVAAAVAIKPSLKRTATAAAPTPRLTRSSSKMAASAAAAAAEAPPLTRSVSRKIEDVLAKLKEYRELIRAALVNNYVVPERLAEYSDPSKAAAYRTFIEKFDHGFTEAAKQGSNIY